MDAKKTKLDLDNRKEKPCYKYEGGTCDPWRCDYVTEKGHGCPYRPACFPKDAGFVEIDCADCEWFIECENDLRFEFGRDILGLYIEEGDEHFFPVTTLKMLLERLKKDIKKGDDWDVDTFLERWFGYWWVDDAQNENEGPPEGTS